MTNKLALKCSTALVSMMLGGGTAYAQTTAFNVKSDEGLRSLPEFAKQAGLQIIAPAETLRGRKLPAIKGNLDTNEALKKLLENTDLEIISNDGTTVTLRVAPKQQAQRDMRKIAADASVSVPSQLAQAAPQAPAPELELEEVVVTGSRIARTNFTSPTPVTVVGPEDLAAAALPNVADFARSLPSLQGGTSASTTSTFVSNGSGGISAMNLRALGTARTLVLLDGQRSAASDATGQVDVNTFPQALVERVEVVTGGASAAYGSDAVGGVVNFILNKRFTGVKGALEYGETTYGDGADRKATLTFGTPFAGGSGHLILSGEYALQDGVHDANGRDWNERTTFAMQNTPANIAAGQPYYLVADNIGVAIRTAGGLINAGPLKGTYFGVGGSVNQFVYGNPVQGQLMRGGDYARSLEGLLGGNSLSADEDRYNVFGRASYETTSGIEIFAQAAYAEHKNLAYYIHPTQDNIVIRADNPYIPASVRTAMGTTITSFTMGSSNPDFPRAGNNGSRNAKRIVVGANGDFPAAGLDVAWDAYYQFGQTNTHELTTQIWNTARLNQATDAVRNASGAIVCRNQADGCLPLNRIGIGVADPAAIAWVFDRPFRDQKFRQDVAAVNFTTSDVAGWAGPISFATGLEYRREQMSGEVDPRFSSGWKLGNFLASQGKYDVTEGYIETVVPLFEGLEVNGAGRFTHYSISGSVQTWKLGLTYQPLDDVKFRLTRSRDIRAPNMSEFFATGSSRSNSVAINGVPTPFVQTLKGNPNLIPETANSLGAGVVFTPAFAPGLAFSVDYYDIKVRDVITTLSAEQTTQFCFQNNVQKYCDNMHFTNGVLQTIDLYYENFNSLRSQGIDFEGAYRTELGQGTLTVRGMATHYIKNITDNGVTRINNAGSNSGSTPDWLYSLTTMYTVSDWRSSLTFRGASGGVVNTAFTECTSACPTPVSPFFTISNNQVKGAFYIDGSIAKMFTVRGADLEVFLQVKNLLNRDPSIVVNPDARAGEHVTQFPQTTRSLYDLLGRVIRTGVRFNF